MQQLRGSAALVLVVCIILLINIAMLLSVTGQQVYLATHLVTDGLDAAAIAGATKMDAALLLRNIPALDKPAAEATTRDFAQRNLAVAQQYLVPTPAELASTMSVWVRNTGEADPWTGAAVTVPTVFVEAPAQFKGLATYGVVGSAPGMFSQDPLAGVTLRVRVKAALRLRS